MNTEKNHLFERLRSGAVLLGVCNMYPAPGIIEGMCSGWDFVWIDGQHGEFSYDSVLHALQAAMAAGIDSLVRVPGHDPGVLGMYADLAPSAIMVPMVNDGIQARAIVDALRFSPLGNRSYGGRRIIDLHGRDYYRNKELLVIAQIETLRAVENASQIIDTNGVDMLFFGPDDMKVQMDIPVNTPVTENQQLRDAMVATAEAAKRAGKYCGGVGANPGAVDMMVRMGYQLIVGGGDIVFLRTLSSERLAQLRAAAKGVIEESAELEEKGIYT